MLHGYQCSLMKPILHTDYCHSFLRHTYGCHRQLTKLCKASNQSSVQPSSETSRRPLLKTVPQMFLAGAIMGPLLDGIHGTVHLLDYKVGAYDIAGLHSSIWVAPLLGAFYAIIGPLHTVLDDVASQSKESTLAQTPEVLKPIATVACDILSNEEDANMTKSRLERLSVPVVALNTGVIALLLEISAILYKNDVPYLGISAILSVLALLSWKAFDGTKQGLFLALLCAISAPLSELVLINVFGVWQYPHPDVFGPGGVPSWVFWCYFFYTSGVGNLARLLRSQGQ